MDTLSRRNFVKGLAAFYGCLALNGRRAFGSVQTASGRSVIVIGAGVSGLAAAQDLQTMGFSVVVLEGRARIGGRMWTDRSLGAPVDLGASWIHSATGNPVSALARKFKVKSTPTNYNNVATYSFHGGAVAQANVDAYDATYQSILKNALALQNALKVDISLAEAFNRASAGTTFSADELAAYRYEQAVNIMGDAADDLEELSLLAYNTDSQFSGADQYITSGYDTVAQGLAKGLDIRMSQTVTKVDWTNGVTVTTKQGTFSADACVVTLPLGVLKAGTVQFLPVLPAAKLHSIAALGFGDFNKIALKYPKPFWPVKVEFLEYISNTFNEFPEWINGMKYLKKPILIATITAAFARQTESMSDADSFDYAHGILKIMFGSSIPLYTGGVVTRWNSDPFSMGSYSNNAVGSTLDDNKALGDPLNNRLFFAGEATHELYPDTVHGAYLSGKREAARIGAAFGA